MIGDMRTVRLGRTFDAVLLHDAVNHLYTEADLAGAFDTAAAHLEPGGAFLLVPERYAENFQDGAASHSRHKRGDCEVAYFEYLWDPDPADTAVERIMVFVIREGGAAPRIAHERFTEGLFTRAAWLRLLQVSGFSLAAELRHDVDPAFPDLKLLVCTRNGAAT